MTTVPAEIAAAVEANDVRELTRLIAVEKVDERALTAAGRYFDAAESGLAAQRAFDAYRLRWGVDANCALVDAVYARIGR